MRELVFLVFAMSTSLAAAMGVGYWMAWMLRSNALRKQRAITNQITNRWREDVENKTAELRILQQQAEKRSAALLTRDEDLLRVKQDLARVEKAVSDKDTTLAVAAMQAQAKDKMLAGVTAELEDARSALSSMESELTRSRAAWSRDEHNLRTQLSSITDRLQAITLERDMLLDQAARSDTESHRLRDALAHLEAEHQTLQGQFRTESEKFRTALRDAEDRMEAAGRTIAGLQSQVSAAAEQQELLARQLREAESAKAAAELRIQQIRSEFDDQFAAADRTIAELRAQTVEASAEIGAMKRELRDAEQSLTAAEDRFVEAQRIYDAKVQELETARAQEAESSQRATGLAAIEVADLQQRLRDAEATHAEASQASSRAIAQSAADRHEMQERLRTSQAEIESLQKQLQSLESARAETAAQSAIEIADLQQRLRDAEATHAAAIADLRTQSAEAGALKQQLQLLESARAEATAQSAIEIADLQQRLRDAEATHAEASQASSRAIAQSAADRHEMQERLRTSQAEIESLQQQLQSLESARAETAAQSAGEITDLQQQLRDAEATHAEASQASDRAMAQSAADLHEMQERLRESQSEIADLQQRLRDAEATHLEAAQTTNRTIADLRTQNAEADAEIAMLLRENRAAEAKHAGQIASMESTVAFLHSEALEAANQIEALRGEIAFSRDAAAAFAATPARSATQAEVELLASQLEDAERAKAAAQRELADLEAEVHARIEALASERDAIELESASIRERIMHLEIELEDARVEQARAEREIEILRGQIAGLEVEFADARRLAVPAQARALAASVGGHGSIVPNHGGWNPPPPPEWQHQLEQARSEVRLLRRRVEECEIEMNEVRAAWDTLRGEMTAENEQLRERLRGATDHASAETQASVRRLRQQVSRLENYAAILEGDKQDLLRELRSHRQYDGPIGLF
ncbi:MAG: hypothetical protein JNL98_13990 [Bryobacterales bacterium]|nr:hypothetical protein [Bryobacterales bacterium]